MSANLRITMVRLTLALISGTAWADDFTLDWYTLDAGGVMNATDNGFELSGTIGQPDAASVVMTGGGYELTGGFWIVPTAPAVCIGDLNCDGTVSFADINPFVLYLTQCGAGCTCPGPISCP